MRFKWAQNIRWLPNNFFSCPQSFDFVRITIEVHISKWSMTHTHTYKHSRTYEKEVCRPNVAWWSCANKQTSCSSFVVTKVDARIVETLITRSNHENIMRNNTQLTKSNLFNEVMKCFRVIYDDKSLDILSHPEYMISWYQPSVC